MSQKDRLFYTMISPITCPSFLWHQHIRRLMLKDYVLCKAHPDYVFVVIRRHIGFVLVEMYATNICTNTTHCLLLLDTFDLFCIACFACVIVINKLFLFCFVSVFVFRVSIVFELNIMYYFY